MKPYPGKKLTEQQRIYNYRLSRGRRTIENAFGILSAKWRIFRRPIKANVDLVELIVQSTVCLHNYLRLTENASYTPEGFIDCESSNGEVDPGDWRKEAVDDGGMRVLNRICGNRYGFEARCVRDDFKEYFNAEGQVPWQLEYVRNCGHLATQGFDV
ncbi:uncharacterized protein LOC114575585 [Exaiptasia diaphana]|uniref:DDE Tnp4 domain-containing protein n=1 Tax=Exaiptasia diaphana TaxID=2652724 RepID=A0A913YQU3_EXADI|nr:uncharacterized protein LOC114575585 [Exaiptasia diaphana]